MARIACAIGLGLCACDAPNDTANDEAVESRSAAADVELTAKPKPRRGKLIRPEVIARAIRWPDARPVRTAAIDRLDQRQLRAAPVPVLVPPLFDDDATVSVGPSWYAFAAHDGDVALGLQGSAQGRIVPGIRAVEPTHTIRNNPGFVTRNEGIWSVSWTENGAAYSLEVSCARPFEPPCDQEQFALDWVDRLVLSGGEGTHR